MALLVFGVILPTVSPQASQLSASFHLAVDSRLLTEHKVRVSGNYSSLQLAGELRLALSPSQTGRYYPIAIEFLKVADSEGRALSVQRRPQPSPSSPELWVVAKGQARFVHVEYLLTLNYYAHDLVSGYLGYAGSAYVVSWAGWVFLLPEEYQSNPSDRTVRVSFSTPSGWEVVTPWVRQADGSFVDTYHAYHFQRSTFGVGLFDVRTRSVQGTQVTVAMDGGFRSGDRDSISNYSFRAFDYIFNLFRAKILDRYLVVYVRRPSDVGGIVGLLEASDSQAIGFASSFASDLIGEFTHRVFHTWNAFPPFGMSQRSNEERWFGEGTDEYYNIRVLLDLGITSPFDTSYFSLRYRLSYYWNEILGTKNDIPLTKSTSSQPYPLWRLAYFKGSLVSYMLDELIKELSGDKHSLADLLATMYESFRDEKCCYSNRDISAVVRSLTGVDLWQFFQAYVYGTERLPLGLAGGRVYIDWPLLLSKINVSLSNTTVVHTTTTSAEPSSTITAARTSSSASTETADVAALEAIRQADAAIEKAKSEGRTLGLDEAIQLLAKARDAYSLSDYAQALFLAEQAKLTADAANSPFEVTRTANSTSQPSPLSFLSLTYAIPVLAALILLITAGLIVKYGRKRRSG